MNSKDSSILINGHQLREALSFLAPDNTDEQLDQEVIISIGGTESHSGPGLYCWAHEYPEEGAIKLDGNSPTALSAPPAAVVDRDAIHLAFEHKLREVNLPSYGEHRGDWRRLSREETADVVVELLKSAAAPPAAGVPDVGALIKRLQGCEPHLTDKVHYCSDEADDYRAYKLDLYIPTPARDPEPFEVAAARWLWVSPTPPASEQLAAAARDVLAERRRQVEDEQWTPEHDDRYRHRQLAMAAACYAAAVPVHDVLDCSDGRIEKRVPAVSRAWPWAKAWWKPGTARQNLVKAGALILAEIERLDRATATGLPEGRPSEAEESQP